MHLRRWWNISDYKVVCSITTRGIIFISSPWWTKCSVEFHRITCNISKIKFEHYTTLLTVPYVRYSVKLKKNNDNATINFVSTLNLAWQHFASIFISNSACTVTIAFQSILWWSTGHFIGYTFHIYKLQRNLFFNIWTMLLIFTINVFNIN